MTINTQIQPGPFSQGQSPQSYDPVLKGNAHVIVFGNEKGGSGKSTAAMHTAVSLLRLGYQVGTIDLDARQGTLTRYMKNRFDTIVRKRKNILSPAHMAITRSQLETVTDQKKEEHEFLKMALYELGRNADFIVIDTPGTDSYLSRVAHSYADTLVTPMNDSLIDLDVLARIDPETHEVQGFSVYSKMVEEQRSVKSLSGGGDLDWIVMRNRLSHINATNKKRIEEILERIAEKLGCRIAPGFGERVIFKELFLQGLTLFDLKEDPSYKLSMSEIAARQEVRQLIIEIKPHQKKGKRQKAANAG